MQGHKHQVTCAYKDEACVVREVHEITQIANSSSKTWRQIRYQCIERVEAHSAYCTCTSTEVLSYSLRQPNLGTGRLALNLAHIILSTKTQVDTKQMVDKHIQEAQRRWSVQGDMYYKCMDMEWESARGKCRGPFKLMHVQSDVPRGTQSASRVMYVPPMSKSG